MILEWSCTVSKVEAAQRGSQAFSSKTSKNLGEHFLWGVRGQLRIFTLSHACRHHLSRLWANGYIAIWFPRSISSFPPYLPLAATGLGQRVSLSLACILELLAISGLANWSIKQFHSMTRPYYGQAYRAKRQC